MCSKVCITVVLKDELKVRSRSFVSSYVGLCEDWNVDISVVTELGLMVGSVVNPTVVSMVDSIDCVVISEINKYKDDCII